MAKPGAKRAKLSLCLYIAGNAPNSVRALANAKALCDEYFSGYELEVVDLLKEPARALADAIIVTPTLVKLRPLPVQRIIGNLSDAEQLHLTLGTK